MNSVVVWLLVSLSATTFGGPRPAFSTVERFVTQAECERVKSVLMANSGQGPLLLCLEATVAR